MAINTTFVSGQIYTAAQANNYPFGVISYTRNTVAVLSITNTIVNELFRGPAFTPVAGRLYRATYSIGVIAKTTSTGNVDVQLRKDSISGTVLDAVLFSAVPVSQILPMSKTMVFTTTQLGTISFVPVVCIIANTNGVNASNDTTYAGTIIFEDIGQA